MSLLLIITTLFAYRKCRQQNNLQIFYWEQISCPTAVVKVTFMGKKQFSAFAVNVCFVGLKLNLETTKKLTRKTQKMVLLLPKAKEK